MSPLFPYRHITYKNKTRKILVALVKRSRDPLTFQLFGEVPQQEGGGWAVCVTPLKCKTRQTLLEGEEEEEEEEWTWGRGTNRLLPARERARADWRSLWCDWIGRPKREIEKGKLEWSNHNRNPERIPFFSKYTQREASKNTDHWLNI